MIDLQNIQLFKRDPPDPNFIGAGIEFAALPETHIDQIIFLNSEGEKYIYHMASMANLITGGFWVDFPRLLGEKMSRRDIGNRPGGFHLEIFRGTPPPLYALLGLCARVAGFDAPSG
ncbi:MAG: hypothetical protein EOP24_37525 [Hyphomicrobiales bacterium]|nr:MAG: hypothetical protein EOP24_37525 [Hyphomicrobiales bacterium]